MLNKQSYCDLSWLTRKWSESTMTESHNPFKCATTHYTNNSRLSAIVWVGQEWNYRISDSLVLEIKFRTIAISQYVVYSSTRYFIHVYSSTHVVPSLNWGTAAPLLIQSLNKRFNKYSSKYANRYSNKYVTIYALKVVQQHILVVIQYIMYSSTWYLIHVYVSILVLYMIPDPTKN